MYRISWIVVFSVGLSLLPPAPAAATDAEAVIRGAIERMYTALRAECRTRSLDPARIAVLAEEILLPHADFETMSRWVMGKHWKRATVAQRRQVMQEFRALLVRTYATAIESVFPVDINYMPQRSSGKQDRAVVRTEVKVPGEAVFPVHYHLRRKEGRWLVYDVRIEGISLVASYRSSFGAEIETRGIQGLIDMLHDKNEEQLLGERHGSSSPESC